VYGPTNALRDDSSCWNSEGGGGGGGGGGDDDDDDNGHWFRLDFGRHVQPTVVSLQFQAGFCAQQGRIEYCRTESGGMNDDNGAWASATEDKDGDDDGVEWDDVHEVQVVPLRKDIQSCTSLRLVLKDYTDFYGRVILYQVQVWGKEVGTATGTTTTTITKTS